MKEVAKDAVVDPGLKDLIQSAEEYWTLMERARDSGYSAGITEAIAVLCHAAYVYAQPVVCEDCAAIVESAKQDPNGPNAFALGCVNQALDTAAAAIRAHSTKEAAWSLDD